MSNRSFYLGKVCECERPRPAKALQPGRPDYCVVCGLWARYSLRDCKACGEFFIDCYQSSKAYPTGPHPYCWICLPERVTCSVSQSPSIAPHWSTDRRLMIVGIDEFDSSELDRLLSWDLEGD